MRLKSSCILIMANSLSIKKHGLQIRASGGHGTHSKMKLEHFILMIPARLGVLHLDDRDKQKGKQNG